MNFAEALNKGVMMNINDAHPSTLSDDNLNLLVARFATIECTHTCKLGHVNHAFEPAGQCAIEVAEEHIGRQMKTAQHVGKLFEKLMDGRS